MLILFSSVAARGRKRGTANKKRKVLGKMLTSPEELAVHMAKIAGVWVCTTCSINFRDKTDCRRHVEGKHITTTIYACPTCDFTTNTEVKFRRHEMNHEQNMVYMATLAEARLD